MACSVTVLGIRHHGPGSARAVERALDELNPDAVLIEGPPDAAAVLPIAADPEMTPPVALLVYDPDNPAESVFYPFAEFSPEWRAIRWAHARTREVRFIDLPQSLRPPRSSSGPVPEPTDGPKTDPPPQTERDVPAPDADIEERTDPLEALAHAAGHTDGEAWWGRLIEEHRADADARAVFDSIREVMAEARATVSNDRRDADEAAREAFMRRSIRTAMRDGFQAIAVVCGAWHAPVLTDAALKATTAKADDEILRPLAKRKTAATWIPWTYDRLSADSGYGAGIRSPGWYEHLWVHRDQISERWMTLVARLLRDEDMEASPASVIECVRLADSLAALRGKGIAGLEELGEATLAVLCHGNPLPMRVIHSKLIVGNRLGRVPEAAPTVPLQRDLAAQQKSLRMKVSADEILVDLDQRKETDLARSRLLHRLRIVKVDWGTLDDRQQQRTSTFHEIWKLRWRPEFAVAVMEAARWGNTVAEAAAAFADHQAGKARSLADLTGMLDDVLLADLPSAVASLIDRIQSLSAVAAELGQLMDALPPMARVLRYGNVRKTDAAMVEPVVAGLVARICVGLTPACASLDDDAAGAMRARIDSVHASLATLERADFLDQWKAALLKLGDADVHGIVAGRAWRHVLDTAAAPPDAAAVRLSRALSRGNDPGKASAWLEGFLGGSGMVLIHDDRLLSIVDEWVCSLSRETFEQVCPIGRRTFATFAQPERRQIGEKLKRAGAPGAAEAASIDDYEPARGSLVDPVLRLILGDEHP